jgi:hypothetical protein
MEVTKKTTFGQGLFTPEECDSGNLSDKQAKLDFLNKAISVTCFALGESIDVSAPWCCRRGWEDMCCGSLNVFVWLVQMMPEGRMGADTRMRAAERM